MAAAGKGDGSRGADNTNSANTGDDVDGFAVAVVRDETRWNVTALDPSALIDLADAERQLKALRATSALFGLLNVDDEFFIIIRPAPGGSQLLLSDATAAVDYDIAVDVLDALNLEVPDLDPDDIDDVEPWEEGDLGVLADLGLPDAVLAVIVGDTDLYADEQVGMIAARLGFAEQLAKVLDTLGR
ncbi:MAG: tRNA adenosine deaminase-associated protein [Gordonia sp.]|jgi:putative tRNA adenosine deaminase-associated protein|uniref:tRNA adenosine deaminase-associated protein n=1 Tax=Gordonia sp. (in: high G+C Gram-positive bacteria) TaxID=84139 RepID=UPI001D7358D4|nr:tRNA adenosine deaminase-associated protein [Gordonia sp. (in: high G+C Gram-positive bacteria)]MCB1296999.1 tRNA adenosine deaminase-associated protein [Gordonia sp. (in: high G+C Gram-positive bacteria)]HQV17160.1 tRNA adenosine deaminase-associated protein [Gordonia sp. (in: high G+C Gram-positive bacteria)]